MFIKCDECGHDNQLGAIFCRECGSKLDVETFRPKINDAKSANNIFGLIRRIVTGIILLILLYIIAAMFIPQSPSNELLTDDQQAKTTEKFKGMLSKMNGSYGENSYVFTADEVTYLFNNEMTEETEGDVDAASYAIENMYFRIDNRGFVHIMIQSKLAGKIPVSFAIKGLLQPDSTELQVVGAQMGHFGMPKFLRKKVIGKFLPVIKDGIVAKVISKSKDFKVENGDFVVDVKTEK